MDGKSSSNQTVVALLVNFSDEVFILWPRMSKKVLRAQLSVGEYLDVYMQ